MKFFFSLVSIFLALSPATLAQAPSEKVNILKLGVGLEYLSDLSARGATFYEGWQVIPIFSAKIFTPKLVMVGSSLAYMWNEDPEGLRAWSRVTSGPLGQRPLYLTQGIGRGLSNERPVSAELEQFFEYGDPRGGEIRFRLAQDIRVHHGQYLSLFARKVAYQHDFKKFPLQAGGFLRVGAGSGNHNRYVYGDGAGNFGFAHYDLGIDITSYPNIHTFYPIFRLQYSSILGDQNRGGNLVASHPENWQAVLLFAVGVLAI